MMATLGGVVGSMDQEAGGGGDWLQRVLIVG